MVFAMDRSVSQQQAHDAFVHRCGVTPSRVRYASPVSHRERLATEFARKELHSRPAHTYTTSGSTYGSWHQSPSSSHEARRRESPTRGPDSLMTPRTAKRTRDWREYAFNLRHQQGMQHARAVERSRGGSTSSAALHADSAADRAATMHARAEVMQAARQRWVEQQLATNSRAHGKARLAREELGGTGGRRAISPPTRPEYTGAPAVPVRINNWLPTTLHPEHANRMPRRSVGAPTTYPEETGRWSAASGDGSQVGSDGIFRAIRHFQVRMCERLV